MTAEQKAALIAAVVVALIAVVQGGTALVVQWLNKKAIAENTKITKEVKVLVNSRYGAVLARQADTLEVLARFTKDPEDSHRAESARVESDNHEIANRKAEDIASR